MQGDFEHNPGNMSLHHPTQVIPPFSLEVERKEKKMVKILSKCNKEIITEDNHTFHICSAVLRQREKHRREALQLFLSVLRVVLLIKSLKLTKYFIEIRIHFKYN